MQVQAIPIQHVIPGVFQDTLVDVLRADLVHPIVSGNKYFKLKVYIAEALLQNKTTLATFGGAWSNHIVATAWAGREAGLKTVGIIRGEQPPILSQPLADAADYGMQLVFMSREAYADKQAVMKRYRQQDWYWVNEGGYGHKGVLGAMEMLQQPGTASYTHIVCACGTGTTVAGLMAAALPHQQCIGISVLKGHHSLNDEVMGLLEHSAYHQPPVFFHDYHFGGYAKHPPELIEWMNGFWRATEIPTDIVYTGKLFYAVKDLVEKNYFLPEHKLLVVHSGGLQGNRSLPAGTLEFL